MNSLENVPTIFHTKRHLNYGDSVYLIGSNSLLGGWVPSLSIELACSCGDIWYKIISLPLGERIEYKFAQSKSNKSDISNFKYDDGPNQQLSVQKKTSIKTENIAVMSFNLRYENEIDGNNAWKLRKDLCASIILSEIPDILGIQESKPSQTFFLKENIGKYYNFYGRGRDFHDSDECVGIFYNKSRFLPLDYGTFWLSENRYQPGTILKNSNFPRIVSWIKLFDDYKKEFLWYFNTHFDHESQKIRKRNSEILLEEMNKICGKNENIILTGDFNANKGEECINMIEKRLNDTDKKNSYTFHNFYGINCFIGKIDFVFAGNRFKCNEFFTIQTSENRNGKTMYPSDHYPIKAILKYND